MKSYSNPLENQAQGQRFAMLDFNAALIFVRVAQCGSFSKAAKVLRMPVSTVSAKVAQLEKRLGVTLMRRTTRQLHLTDLGNQYFLKALQAVNELQLAEEMTLHGREDLRGRVRITAPVEMGSTSLIHVLADFLKRFPAVTVDLLLSDRIVDLTGEGVDLAVRMGPLQDSSLISKKIGVSMLQMYASPSYLKKSSPLRRPQDLENHQCLMFNLRMLGEWELRRGESVQNVKVVGPFSANNLIAVHHMCLHHFGVAMLPSVLCQEDVEKKRLVQVLEGWASNKTPVHLVYAKQPFMPKSTRAVLDHLSVHLHELF